jgi:RNA polymerase sigma-70 factor (ECF subfamily)
VLLKNHHEAEEAAQDVFLRLIRAQAENDPVVSWKAWLTTVAVNACRDRRRSSWWKGWSGHYVERPGLTFPVDEDTPEKYLLSRERQAQAWRRFNALSPRQREVFVLRRLECFSTDDTARILGLASGSVKRHLFLATRSLQRAIGGP